MLKGPEPIASPPALRADGICFGFAQRPLFQHWSADFPAGLVLVQGGDGAGKTSLLRLMAAYSTRWRTRFHADGGQCSSVMADSVPR